MALHRDIYSTGEAVPASGIYSVTHAAHRLFAEVAMFKGEAFPKCARCADVVIFSKVREFRGLDAVGTPSFRVPLLELAVIEPVPDPVSAG